jgi:hypothetical protein
MSEHSVPLGQEFGSGDADPADPAVAKLQQSANLANENCDRAVALAQTLSAQLREAQDRINQLEREAEGVGGQLLAEAKAIIQEVRSDANARVNRTIREAEECIDRLKADAQNQIGRLQNELAQATRRIDQVKGESDTRIESVKMEADARVHAAETEAKERVDVIQRENEGKVLRLEADLTKANDRADRAEQWLMLIRREIEEHLMPAMRDGPKHTNSVARPRSLTLATPSHSSASTWFQRLWLRVNSRAAPGCRVRTDIEPTTSVDRAPQHEPGFSNGLSVTKIAASEPSAPLRSGGNSAALNSVTTRESGRVKLGFSE